MRWQHDIVLTKLREGCTNAEASLAAGVDRKTLYRWRQRFTEFAREVEAARRTGEAERTYRAWLRHPFRGKRPPSGKGNGGKPRFSYGRR